MRIFYIMKCMQHYVYILTCKDNTLYVGATNNLERRLHEHNHSKQGAHYTKIRRPVALAYYEECDTLENARRREAEIKKLKREDKLVLIKTMRTKAKTANKPRQNGNFSV